MFPRTAHYCILVPFLSQGSDTYVPDRPRDVKEIMINQTHSSIAQWFSFLCSQCRCFSGGLDSACPLTHLYYSSSSVGLDQKGQPLFPHAHQPWMSVAPITSYLVFVILPTTFGRYQPLHTGNTPKDPLCVGDTLTKSSCHHNRTSVKVVQIFLVVHFVLLPAHRPLTADPVNSKECLHHVSG